MIVGMRFYSLLSFPFFTGGAFLFLLFEELCLEICLTSSISLSDSVSTNCLDLLRFPFMMGLAVADFLGTTLGCCCLDTPGFLEEAAPPFFLEAAASCSESSSLIGRGLAFAFVTNPDFLFVTGVGFFLFFSDVGSFLLGLLVGLLCNSAENNKNHFSSKKLTCLLLAELSESEELPDPLEDDEDDPEEDEEDVLEPEVLPLIRGFGGIVEICEQF